MSDGEFHFTLTEKQDRNGDMYLFAGVRILNSVLFIRPAPFVPGAPQRWYAVLKPYRSKGDEENYEPVWTESEKPSKKETKR